MQTGYERERVTKDDLDAVISELIDTCKQQRLPFQAALEDAQKRIASVTDRLKGDEMQLREELAREREAHKAAMENGLQLYKKLDKAEQAVKRTQSALDETHSACEVLKVQLNEAKRALAEERELQQLTAKERDEWRQRFEAERPARGVVIEERNEAERILAEARKVHAEISSDRMRLIVELNECQQHRDRLQVELEELQRRIGLSELEIQKRRDEAGSKDGTAIEASCTCEDILTALKSAADALEYLAEIGDDNECAYYSGFAAAIHVVQKFKERTKCEKT